MTTYPNPILNCVATGSTTQRLLQDRFAQTLIVDDFKLAADPDDTLALRRAITRAGVLGAGLIQCLTRTYTVSATIVISNPNIMIAGMGKGLTVIARNTAFGDSLQFNNGGQLINCGVANLSMFHDISGGAVMSGGHINAIGLANFLLENVDFTYGKYGFICQGGVYIRVANCHFTGVYDGGVTPAKNSIAADIYLPTANAGAIPIPTIVSVENCIRNGLAVDSNWQYGTVINACEQINFSAGTWNTGPINNIYIQQLNNQPILEVTVSNGSFIDACQEAGVFIDGSSGTNNGSAPIDRIRFDDTSFNGEGVTPILGPGVGILVDGTSRGGAYDQALQSLEVNGCTIQGYYSDGMRINGGSNIIVTGSHIKDNNHSNAAGTNQITVGAAVKNINVVGNRIGGAITGGSTSLAKYGLQIANGATGVVVEANNMLGNTTGGILDNSTAKPKITANNIGYNGARAATSPAMPASTVAYTNALGSAATVSIFGGTVTAIVLNGQTISSATNLIFTVGANDTVAITYTVAPSWIWWPQ